MTAMGRTRLGQLAAQAIAELEGAHIREEGIYRLPG